MDVLSSRHAPGQGRLSDWVTGVALRLSIKPPGKGAITQSLSRSMVRRDSVAVGRRSVEPLGDLPWKGAARKDLERRSQTGATG